MIWFTSDTHAFHENIAGPTVSKWKSGYRNFRTVDHMNHVMATNINEVVRKSDTLVHLGDFAFTGFGVEVFREMINCQNIILVKGNHDNKIIKGDLEKLFTAVYPSFVERKYHGQHMTLCHYAMRVWNRSQYGAWHLYGHSHGSLRDDPNSLSFDVGVDCHDFKPLSFEQVREFMKVKTWKPYDHHGRRGS